MTLVGLGARRDHQAHRRGYRRSRFIFIQALLVNLVFPDPGSTAGRYVLLWAGQASAIRAHVTSYPPVGQSLAVCIAYAAAALATAGFLMTRRDA